MRAPWSWSSSWSIELSATGLLKAGSASARLLPSLPLGTRVYLPALPTDAPDAIERALQLLRRESAGAVPVPHIPASRVPSATALERQLCAWQRASGDGVREVLIVRGDPHAHHGTEAGGGGGAAASSSTGAAALGPYDCSLDLLETGVLQGAGIDAVSLCGHPEGVGGLSAAEACAALEQKLQWAAASNVKARVVTQFCFDASTTTAYAERLRAAGLGTALSVGVVGPTKPEVRARMAERCGVAAPAPSADEQSPTAYVRALAEWQRGRSSAEGVQALHVYPFGGLARTLRWIDELEGCKR